jgi:hypothetical protein
VRVHAVNGNVTHTARGVLDLDRGGERLGTERTGRHGACRVGLDRLRGRHVPTVNRRLATAAQRSREHRRRERLGPELRRPGERPRRTRDHAAAGVQPVGHLASGLAEVNAASGSVTTWNPAPDGPVDRRSTTKGAWWAVPSRVRRRRDAQTRVAVLAR